MQGTSTLKIGLDLPTASIDPYLAASVLLLIVFIITVVFSLIVGYHWLRYGHRSPFAIPALTLHAFVSMGLLLFATSGLV